MEKAFLRLRYHSGVVVILGWLRAVFPCSQRVKVYLGIAAFLAVVLYITLGRDEPKFDPLPVQPIPVDIIAPRRNEPLPPAGDWGEVNQQAARVIRNNEGRIIIMPDRRKVEQWSREEKLAEENIQGAVKPTSLPEGADVEWLSRRQEVQSGSKIRRVLVYTYTLSGPDPLGALYNTDGRGMLYPRAADPLYSSLFAYDPDSLPLDLIYYWNSSHRVPGAMENRAIFDYFKLLYQCNFSALPVEALQHSGLRESRALGAASGCGEAKEKARPAAECRQRVGPFCGALKKHHRDTAMADERRCVEVIQGLRNIPISQWSTEVYRNLSVNIRAAFPSPDGLSHFVAHSKCIRYLEKVTRDCATFITKLCSHFSLRVTTVNRLPIEDLHFLLQEIPDLYVIYHPRDPRPEAIARTNSGTLSWQTGLKSPTTEARMLCMRMRNDLKALRKLTKRYPGAFFRLTLEGLISSPVSAATTLFKQMGLQPPSKVHIWKKESVDAVVKCHDQFGPFRCSPVTFIKSWRSEVTKDIAKIMSAMCQDVLEELGYEI